MPRETHPLVVRGSRRWIEVELGLMHARLEELHWLLHQPRLPLGLRSRAEARQENYERARRRWDLRLAQCNAEEGK